MAEAEPRVTPPLGPTDAFSAWPTLLSARLGVASDGSVWAYVKGAVSMVAPAGTIPHPMLATMGAADALIAHDPEPHKKPEPEPEPEPEPHKTAHEPHERPTHKPHEPPPRGRR
jgi:hypothetical protein